MIKIYKYTSQYILSNSFKKISNVISSTNTNKAKKSPSVVLEPRFTDSLYTGYSRARRSFLQLLWLLCIWLVWNERNNRLFNNTETSIEHLLDKTKFHSLWWLKANKITFVYSSHNWWSNPLLCLGID